MVTAVFFFITAIEAFLLSAYLAMVGSLPQEQALFGLSPLRLAAASVVIVAGLAFLLLGIAALKKHGRVSSLFQNILENARLLWAIVPMSFALSAFFAFLLTREGGAYGDYQVIYSRLEPIIAWVYLLFLQTGLAALVWIFFHHANRAPGTDLKENEREILLVFVLFGLSILHKLLLVSPHFFGPTIVGDEIKYFDAAESLYRGFFFFAQSHHYPPLYPISFFFTMVFGDHIFEGIKLVNILLSASTVFPIYLLTRQFAGRRLSLSVAFISLLTPYHLLFPGHILSENLFVPLFLWIMWITFTGPADSRQKPVWDLVNGMLIGCLYLTRYITLPLIPGFLLAWWIKPFEKATGLFRVSVKKVLHLFLLIAGLLIVFFPWINLAIQEGLPVREALGFGIASDSSPRQLTLYNLLMYFCLYLAYLVLISAPVLNSLISGLAAFKWKKWRSGLDRFVLQTAFVLSGFLAATARHSWRAYYNADGPLRIMGRYLTVFSALSLILGAAGITRQTKDHTPKRPLPFLAVHVALPILIILLAYMLIFHGFIFPTDGSIILIQDSADGYFIKLLGPFFWVLVLLPIVAQAALVWFGRGKTAAIVFAIMLAVFFVSGSGIYSRALRDYQTFPWLANQVADIHIERKVENSGDAQISIYYPPHINQKNRSELFNTLRIRGAKPDVFEANTPQNLAEFNAGFGYAIVEISVPASTGSQLSGVIQFSGRFFRILPLEALQAE